MAAIPGLLALWLYYRGLANTPASAATVAELAFPPSALVINRVAFGTTLTTSQGAGIALLSGTFLVLGQLSQRGYEHVGVEAPRTGSRRGRSRQLGAPYLEGRLEPEEVAVAVPPLRSVSTSSSSSRRKAATSKVTRPRPTVPAHPADRQTAPNTTNAANQTTVDR